MSGIVVRERGLLVSQVEFEVVLLVKQIVVRETYLVYSPHSLMGVVLMPSCGQQVVSNLDQ